MTVFALRPETTLHDVGAVLERLGFEIVAVEAGEGDDLRRISFADDARTTRAMLVEDGYLDVNYLSFVGTGTGRAANEVVEARLAYDAERLLATAQQGLDPLDRESLKTLVRLALSASPDLEADVRSLFDRLSREGAEPVRFTLISAISCRAVQPGGLAAFRPVLNRLADEDPSEMVRDEARLMRAALDEAPDL
ncbi:MAG TPA: hypothetical protein VD948_00090 [Rhodothermales bacterium]|nr:hypothetical protein [Rhodothermales bacterium]